MIAFLGLPSPLFDRLIVRGELASDATAAMVGAFIGGAGGALAGAPAGPAGAAAAANLGAVKGAAAGYVASRATRAVARAIMNFSTSAGSGGDRTRTNEVRERKDGKQKRPTSKPKSEKASPKIDKEHKKREIGQAGRYEQLTKPSGFNDNMEAHHMPSQKWLRAHGQNKDDGFSAMMTKEQHKKTRTFGIRGSKESVNRDYRSEMGRDVKEYIRILKSDGSWTPEVRRSLMQGLDNFKKEFPDLFKKVTK